MPFDDIRQGRIEKLNKLRTENVDPYPAKSWRTHSVMQALEEFDALVESRKPLVLAGRVMARREHGGSTFADLFGGTGTIQVFFKRDKLGEREYQQMLDTLDIGDFIEVSGVLFLTKKNEKTLEAEKYRMLAKTLRPLPEKWHGLHDVEERFRKRYLDLLFNPEVKRKFEVRAKVLQALREFMNANGFIEVTTPTLQPLYGGASARPFKTHLNALDIDMYLRIAPELYLKRLLVGGFESVYEFTTNFRNEGIDRDHNPEFSAMEFYTAYRDIGWATEFTEKMFTTVLKHAIGADTVVYEKNEIAFRPPYARLAFADALRDHTGIDYDIADADTLLAKAKELGLVIEKNVEKASLADEIFKKTIRPKLIQPTFVTDYPVELLPLAKRTENPDYVGAFQFYAGGLELIKAFSELNDPLDQRARMEVQESRRAKGDQEAQRLDEDYIEALEYGMPPAAGWGIGLDRFVALLTDSHSIRDIILFPLMKPRE